MAAIADKLEIDPAVIGGAKPTSATAAKQAIDNDKDVIENKLTEQLRGEVAALTIDYADRGHRKDLKQTNTASVDRDGLVGRWAKHVEQKMTFRCKAEWDVLTDGQKKLLFFKASKEYTAVEAAQKDADNKNKDKEGGRKRARTDAAGGGRKKAQGAEAEAMIVDEPEVEGVDEDYVDDDDDEIEVASAQAKRKNAKKRSAALLNLDGTVDMVEITPTRNSASTTLQVMPVRGGRSPSYGRQPSYFMASPSPKSVRFDGRDRSISVVHTMLRDEDAKGYPPIPMLSGAEDELESSEDDGDDDEQKQPSSDDSYGAEVEPYLRGLSAGRG